MAATTTGRGAGHEGCPCRCPVQESALMRTSVALSLCPGYANCVIEADRLFDVDESTERAVVLLLVVAPDLEDDARRAAASCPVS
jgi:ferredoxin